MKKNKILSMFCIILLSMLSSCVIGMPYTKTVDYENLTPYQAVRYRNDFIDLDSEGEQNVLVIPVEFLDYQADDIAFGRKNSISYIEKAFFGDSEDTGWESLTSFYSKSSYGKLNITGTVADWVSIPYSTKTLSQVMPEVKNDPTVFTDKVLKYVVEQVKKQVPEYHNFDKNNDGYFDAVWMIYSAPSCTTNMTYTCNNLSDLLWAYTYWDYRAVGNIESPVANAYSWCSYDFLFNDSYSSLPDAHTIIHETGHLLGLDDYYDYDFNGTTNLNCPIGKSDMMDFNIVDHNSFSKYLLNWIEPIVLDQPGIYTLENFQISGQSYLIPTKTHNGIFSEYLLLEYYRPTHLNYQDSNTPYGDQQLKGINADGLKIYHADARVATFNSKGDFVRYVTNYVDNYYCYLAHSNTTSRTVSGNNLLGLLDGKERNIFKNFGTADSDTLFKVGDDFGLKRYLDFKFNNGETLDYALEVTNINQDILTFRLTSK